MSNFKDKPKSLIRLMGFGRQGTRGRELYVSMLWKVTWRCIDIGKVRNNLITNTLIDI